jgi:hypothetical protein
MTVQGTFGTGDLGRGVFSQASLAGRVRQQGLRRENAPASEGVLGLGRSRGYHCNR